MKKVLIAMLAVLCLFATVSCKDDDIVEKLDKLPVMYTLEEYGASLDEYVIGQFVQNYMFSLGGRVDILSKKATIKLNGEYERIPVDGTLTVNYDPEAENVITGSFDGTFEESANLEDYRGKKAVSFYFVNLPLGSLDPLDVVIENNPDNTSDNFKKMITSVVNQCFLSGTARGDGETAFVESIKSTATTKFTNEELEPFGYFGVEPERKPVTLLVEDTTVEVTSTYERGELFTERVVNPCTTGGFNMANKIDFKVETKYKYDNETYPLKMTVTVYQDLRGRDPEAVCGCSAFLTTVNYEGKTYRLPFSFLF